MELTLLCYICTLVLSTAIPLKDVSSTSITVAESNTTPSSERFAVTVSRIDDLLDDDGSLVAERLMSVIMSFDLHDNELLLNGVPITLGAQSIEVIQAEVAITSQEKVDLDKQFDIGLVTVEVESKAEAIPTEDPNVVLRRINISTRVIEIDGQEVIQTESTEKIFEVKTYAVFEDDDEGFEAIPSDSLSVKQSLCGSHVFSKIERWWRRTSRLTRILIGSFCLTFILSLLTIIVAYTIVFSKGKMCHRSYESLADEIIFDQVIYIADEEKKALMEKEEESKK
ncbi:10194_t:CDS:1 [Paraglomus occultum]|uniref:10194_t:CDS:1 n=1 Tax=Paraglomus occultum TaxID=144539 RepID=A0A9N9BIB2_9GLOM|nr:10194_t:CDS:1 [Paraglomus occultum]